MTVVAAGTGSERAVLSFTCGDKVSVPAAVEDCVPKVSRHSRKARGPCMSLALSVEVTRCPNWLISPGSSTADASEDHNAQLQEHIAATIPLRSVGLLSMLQTKHRALVLLWQLPCWWRWNESEHECYLRFTRQPAA